MKHSKSLTFLTILAFVSSTFSLRSSNYVEDNSSAFIDGAAGGQIQASGELGGYNTGGMGEVEEPAQYESMKGQQGSFGNAQLIDDDSLTDTGEAVMEDSVVMNTPSIKTLPAIIRRKVVQGAPIIRTKVMMAPIQYKEKVMNLPTEVKNRVFTNKPITAKHYLVNRSQETIVNKPTVEKITVQQPYLKMVTQRQPLVYRKTIVPKLRYVKQQDTAQTLAPITKPARVRVVRKNKVIRLKGNRVVYRTFIQPIERRIDTQLEIVPSKPQVHRNRPVVKSVQRTKRVVRRRVAVPGRHVIEKPMVQRIETVEKVQLKVNQLPDEHVRGRTQTLAPTIRRKVIRKVIPGAQNEIRTQRIFQKDVIQEKLRVNKVRGKDKHVYLKPKIRHIKTREHHTIIQPKVFYTKRKKIIRKRAPTPIITRASIQRPMISYSTPMMGFAQKKNINNIMVMNESGGCSGCGGGCNTGCGSSYGKPAISDLFL